MRHKPNLIDPIFQKKIVTRLTPPPLEDYWAPTKDHAHSIWQNIIKPHILLMLVIICIIIFLLHRYLNIKKKKHDEPLKTTKDNLFENKYSNNKEEDDFKLMLYLYNKQKDSLREPVVRLKSSRAFKDNNKTEMAYPVYPYGSGDLSPSRKR